MMASSDPYHPLKRHELFPDVSGGINKANADCKVLDIAAYNFVCKHSVKNCLLDLLHNIS